MKQVIEKLREHVAQEQPDFGDGKPVLTMLYEACSDCNRLDDDQIKADFNEFYRLMNGMELREMDRIIYPVCKLCRDHEHSGFTAGVQMGIVLSKELNS